MAVDVATKCVGGQNFHHGRVLVATGGKGSGGTDMAKKKERGTTDTNTDTIFYGKYDNRFDDRNYYTT
jgi:hypothetical protein